MRRLVAYRRPGKNFNKTLNGNCRFCPTSSVAQASHSSNACDNYIVVRARTALANDGPGLTSMQAPRPLRYQPGSSATNVATFSCLESGAVALTVGKSTFGR